MPEQPPAFVVVDKRKFTSDGAIREGFVEPEQPKAPPQPVQHGPEPGLTTEPESSSAKVVTMPVRPGEPMTAADDMAEEEMAGSLAATAADGYDVDGDGPETDSDLADFEDPIGEPRSAAETAAQATAYQQSSKDLDSMLQQANPGMQQPGTVTFEHVIQSFYLSAIMAMGAGAEPGQKPRIDILGARQSIDMLAVLEDKTRGNLSVQEQQLLQGVTFEMRMMFLELTNAISKQAHQPGPAPGGLGSTPPGGSLR